MQKHADSVGWLSVLRNVTILEGHAGVGRTKSDQGTAIVATAANQAVMNVIFIW